MHKKDVTCKYISADGGTTNKKGEKQYKQRFIQTVTNIKTKQNNKQTTILCSYSL